MTEQENNIYLLHGKLEYYFKNYLLSNPNTFHLENFVKNTLQNQFHEDREFIDRLLQNLQLFVFNHDTNKVDKFMMNLCINNLKNETLIKELLNFVNMQRNDNDEFFKYKQKINNKCSSMQFNDKQISELYESSKEFFVEYMGNIETTNSKLDSIQNTINELLYKIKK